MDQNTNRRVFVALPNGCAVTEIDRLKLLSEAEIDLSSTQFVRGDSDLAAMSSNGALVVVLVDHHLLEHRDALSYDMPGPKHVTISKQWSHSAT